MYNYAHTFDPEARKNKFWRMIFADAAKLEANLQFNKKFNFVQ